ncbi:hypothetical protein FNV43_RR26758 [Rhamnella rubrinervis]|uniref:Uncharacterized protein n=1 Tax=Rhamnella rubrinervis TaxID=2594499 RepID=A0A8K0DPY1_9ROSA|nr:hypothetical protein FNV43_RR26758 [Rhamnella rubrinervis]
MEKYHNDEKVAMEQFEAMTKDAERVQRDVLKKILEENGSAEYLQKQGLNGRTDPESYKACVPIVTYNDLEPYIQRIADGDSSAILTGKPITYMVISSGTSQGKAKLVPFNDKMQETIMQMNKISFILRSREFPLGKGKALQFIYGSHKEHKTKGGIAIGHVSSKVFSSPEYKNAMKVVQSQACSPEEVIQGPDFHQSVYCHLLCGLIFREEIQLISSTFAHNIVHAFRTFEQIWEELCADIRFATISNRITDPDVRTSMSKLLSRPNPELADLIYKKCRGLSNWSGLIPEIFPNVKYIYGIMTGSMEYYSKKLKHYAGEVPLVSSIYVASEVAVGSCIHPKLPPELVTYLVFPTNGYFEFLPLKDHGTSTEPTNFKTVGLTEVNVDEEYEIIITNFAGDITYFMEKNMLHDMLMINVLPNQLIFLIDKLAGCYRYRLGDIVKVMGFHNSCPELKFVCRKNVLLNINIDKSTEEDIELAVEEASKVLGEAKSEIVDFTTTADLLTDPGHYVVFWELSGDQGSDEVLRECCNLLDLSFTEEAYVISRKDNSIGPLELRIVEKGTFQKVMMEYLLAVGGSAEQYKTPRCVGPANYKVLQILCDNVVKSYFSTALR